VSYTAGQKLRATQMGGAYVCTSTTRPAGHFGQTIIETDTGMMLVYNGSTWKDLAVWDSTVSHEWAATQTIAQSIPTVTDRPLAFNNVVTTSADVTQGTSTAGAIANGKITVNRAGIWSIEAGIRWSVAVSGSQYGIWISSDGGTSRYANQFSNQGGVAAFDQSCSIMSRFPSGSTFVVNAWQNSAGAVNTGILNGAIYLRATWIRP
jgi:hypothetical protein